MRIQTPSSSAITFGNYFQMNIPFGGYNPCLSENHSSKRQEPVFKRQEPVFKRQEPVSKGQTPVIKASIQPNDGGCTKHVKSCQPIKPQVPGEEIKEGQKLNALV